jgi:hypothetical protein
MSWNVSIYLDPAPSLEVLAKEVGDLLGVHMQEIDEDGRKYQYDTQDFILYLDADHGMENDRDMNFEDYQYQISLWRHNSPNTPDTRTNTLKFARLAFDQLRKTGRYRLMLVENGQRKLEAFAPTGSVA